MRLAFAATLALLSAVPAFAGSHSTINVGLVVTGGFASPLTGSWHAQNAAGGGIYHFVVGSGAGTFYEFVSAGACKLRVSGMIYSFERASGSGYEMQYSVQSADVVASSADAGCEHVAASYLSDIPAAQSMLLSSAGNGRLIDRATGAEYLRTR